jgi:hypothetical protein
MRLTSTLILALAGLALVSCSKSKAVKPALTAPAAQAPGGALAGAVLEVLPAPPYSYLRLKTAQGEVWAAVPAAEFKVGAEVAITTQIRMEKFESPSLHRIFDAVWFGTLAGAAAATNPHGTGAAPSMVPPPPLAPDQKIAKATGANAHTIAELYAGRTGLSGKTITVQGKIMKYNEGIMGKTWIHLRDGSGLAQSGDNDLTVTTLDTAKLGDVVTVKGVVHLNKDVGMGYAYPVIIEDAKLTH